MRGPPWFSREHSPLARWGAPDARGCRSRRGDRSSGRRRRPCPRVGAAPTRIGVAARARLQPRAALVASWADAAEPELADHRENSGACAWRRPQRETGPPWGAVSVRCFFGTQAEHPADVFPREAPSARLADGGQKVASIARRRSCPPIKWCHTTVSSLATKPPFQRIRARPLTPAPATSISSPTGPPTALMRERLSVCWAKGGRALTRASRMALCRDRVRRPSGHY
jgi:hypothetical protein